MARRHGINLGWYLDYETGGLARRDWVPQGREWFGQDPGTTNPFFSGVDPPLTADGWPVPAPGEGAATLLARDLISGAPWETGPVLYTGGPFRCRFKGTGTVSVQFDAASTSTSSGEMGFQVTPSTGGILLKVEASDAGDPVRDIRIFREEDLDLYEIDPWRPEFLESVDRSGDWLRFMQWQQTNFQQIENWTDRATPTTALHTLWTRGGMAIEWQIDLCNRLKKDPWFCIPHKATDAFVQSMAQLILERLDPSLSVYIEYTNEPWNSGFKFAPITGTPGQYKFLADYAAAQGIDQSGGGTDEFIGVAHAYGRLSKAKVEVFRAVFAAAGQGGRVIRCFGGWFEGGGGQFFCDTSLQFEDAYLGFDLLALGPYFGRSSHTEFPNGKAAVIADMRADLAANAGLMDTFRSLAQGYGLEPVAYECGHHLDQFGQTYWSLAKEIVDGPETAELTSRLLSEGTYRWGEGSLGLFTHVGKGDSSGLFMHEYVPGGGSLRMSALQEAQVGGVGGVRVQRGEVSFGAAAKTADVTIEQVRTDRAFVRITNVLCTSLGPDGGTFDDVPMHDLSALAELVDGNTLRFTKQAGSAAQDHRVTWELWEYVGNPGGEYEFAVRRQGIADLPNGTTNVRIGLSNELSQVARCSAIRTGLSTNRTAGGGYPGTLAKLDLDPATDELVVNLATSNGDAEVGFAVIEWMGPAWTVQRFEHQFAQAGQSEAVSLSLVDWSRSFILASHQMQSGQTGCDEVGYLLFPDDQGTLRARLDPGADNVFGGEYQLVGWVVSAAGLSVHHVSSLEAGQAAHATGLAVTDVTIPTLPKLHGAGVLGWSTSSGAPVDFPRPNWSYWLEQADTVRFERGRVGSDGEWALQVVQFPDPDQLDVSARPSLTVLGAAGLEVEQSTSNELGLASELALGLELSAGLGVEDVELTLAADVELALLTAANLGLDDTSTPVEELGLTAGIELGIELSGSLVVGDPEVIESPLQAAGQLRLNLFGLLSLADGPDDGGGTGVGTGSPETAPGPSTPDNLGTVGGGLDLRPGRRPETWLGGDRGEVSAAVGGLASGARPNRLREELELRVSGGRWTGWTATTLSRSLETCAASFQVRGMDRAAWPARVGDEVELMLGRETLLTGHIDQLDALISGSEHVLSLTGRDRTADVVDCSTLIEPPELYGVGLLELAKRLAGPFGVGVEARASDLGSAFAKFALQPGETAWQALERACRLRGVLATSTVAGGLLLVKPGDTRAVTALRYGVNVKRARLRIAGQNRFREIIVRGQGGGPDLLSEEEIGALEASARDPRVRQRRRLLMLGEANLDLAAAERRARWEVAVRAARGTELEVVVQGWRQVKRGPLWAPNLVAAVEVPPLRIGRDMLIKSVQLSEDSTQGRQATLVLTRPDAYRPEPANDPGADPGGYWWTGGDEDAG